MKRVFKYQLGALGVQELAMPAGAVPLTVQMQRGELCLWAMVNDEAPMTRRYFRVVGTGHSAGLTGAYIGTVQMHSAELVFHVFEAPDPTPCGAR